MTETCTTRTADIDGWMTHNDSVEVFRIFGDADAEDVGDPPSLDESEGVYILLTLGSI